MASRREALQVGVGGAIFGVAGRAKSLADLKAMHAPMPPPPSHAPDYAYDNCKQAEAIKPLMDHTSAVAKVFGDALLRDQVRASLYEDYRYDTNIDPDLLILKSISPMAKIALTRQRRVEREMKRVYSLEFGPGPSLYSPMRDWLHGHVKKVMWGH